MLDNNATVTRFGYTIYGVKPHEIVCVLCDGCGVVMEKRMSVATRRTWHTCRGCAKLMKAGLPDASVLVGRYLAGERVEDISDGYMVPANAIRALLKSVGCVMRKSGRIPKMGRSKGL